MQGLYPSEMFNAIKQLFHGNDQLIMGFYNLLPEGYEMSHTDGVIAGAEVVSFCFGCTLSIRVVLLDRACILIGCVL